MLGQTGPCAKFQFDRIMGSGSFLTSVFPPARPPSPRQRERERERDGREVNIRDLKRDHVALIKNTAIAASRLDRK